MVLKKLWYKFKTQHVGKVFLTGCLFCIPMLYSYVDRTDRRKIIWQNTQVSDKVYMDIGIADRYAGRIVIGLYGKQVPLTVENFIALCNGYQVDQNKKVGYKNTEFYRTRPGTVMFGGDVLRGNGSSRGMSIYGPSYPDENFHMDFVQDGDIGSFNWGPNTNSSHFFITMMPLAPLHGRYVAFGTVVKGMKTVRDMANQTARTGQPVNPIRILGCGVFDETKPPPVPAEFVQTHRAPVSMLEFERHDQKGFKGVGKAWWSPQ